LYQVKTNKEYDAISNETEKVKQTIDELEKTFLTVDDKIENMTSSNETMKKELVELKKDFEESSSELNAKINASSEEENILSQERDIVEKKLTQQQLSAYERIREAKKGMAVASCNGGVCSGCYSFVPPQKVVEIRNVKKLYYCESCGRIMVWDKNIE
jgi:predicted  nucleic acid-binding Zn-ribbon protein